MSAELLPLFPLEVVLFPGTSLPLHIFEPRYKLMIGRCLEERREFGVILARKEGVAGVGCSAEIVQVVKRYEDGRLDIVTVGQNRFRLREVIEGLPYLQGRVDFLADKEELSGHPGSSGRLLKLYGEAFHVLYGRQPETPEEGSGVSLAFSLASELPLDLDFKQQLLELLSEAERQQSLAGHLEALLPELQRRERVRQKAGGNGRGG